MQPFEETYTEYVRKARSYARGSFFVAPGYKPEDMEQELLLVLWQCWRGYSERRGVTFNTYVQRAWQNRISNLKRRYDQQCRVGDRSCVCVDDWDSLPHNVVEFESAVIDRVEFNEGERTRVNRYLTAV